MMDMTKMKDRCEEVSGLLKHFSHPQRLLILCFLADGEKPVSEIQTAVGLSQSQTSQFLQRMQSEGLVASRREKTFSYYSISNPDVEKLLKSLKKIFC